MRDKLGNEIQVGDQVAYAMSQSNTASLAIGEVREILKDGIRVMADGRTRETIWTKNKNMVVVK